MEALWMARSRRKVLPARKSGTTPADGEPLFIRSAESLGRVIGQLQRELAGMTRTAKRAPAARRRKTTGRKKR